MLSMSLSILWITLELISFLLFHAALLPLRRRKKTVLITFSVTLLAMILYSNIGMDALLKQVVSIVVISCVSKFLYQGKWIVHFLLTGICYIFLNVFDAMVAYGMCFLLDITYMEYVWMKMTYITITTVGKLVFVWICWLIGRFRSLGEIQNVQLRWLVLIILFPLISMAMLILTFFNSQTKEDISVNVVMFGAILAIANIAILYIITKIEAATRQEKDMELLRQQIAMQSDNFSALENSYRLQRKSTHEFQRHLQTLQDLLQQKEYTTAESYLTQLQSNRTLHTFCINSHHPVIDVILNQKYQLAQDYDIKMQVQVNDLSGLELQTESLVVLLSNLLDNAIEACRKCKDRREICCSILYSDVLYLSIRNTSDPVTFQDGKFKSSKINGLNHGYGIPAAKYILNQLSAEYTFEYSDGWFQFVAEIEI